MFENLSQKSLGLRVKKGRESKGWTQEQLSEALGINDRQTISDIENGKRAVKPDELVRLTDVLDRDLEYFLDPFAVAGEAQFSWRAAPEVPQERLDRFESRAGRWIGLLRWLREAEHGRINPLKHSLRLAAQSSFEDAQQSAERLVETLDLGLVPAERLIERIERDLDILVLFVDTDDTSDGNSISGATCHVNDLRVILVARHESEGRRFYDLAHELFHALTWDAIKPAHRESNSFEERARGKRVEQLANNFAAALLMPLTALNRVLDRRRMDDFAHLTQGAMQLRVAPAALAWRLFNLKWIGDDTRVALTAERQRTSMEGAPKRLSLTFVQMLQGAIDHGRLSARKAAKALDMTLSQLGDLFHEHGLTVPFEL
jgi:Zn-dependent peptidase ImmA (M78 family)/transcriptional regulator with XRE-family HTH domain